MFPNDHSNGEKYSIIKWLGRILGIILAQLTFFHIHEIWLLNKPDCMYYTDILQLFWCLSPNLINYFMDYQLHQ